MAQSDAPRQWPLASKVASGALRNWLNIVANKEYIERLQMALNHLHGCNSTWVKSVPVKEVFQGQTIWQGVVEIFDLNGHSEAKRAYGWSHSEGPDDKGERFVTVLELPPVDSAQAAVKVSIVSDIKKGHQ